MQEELTTRGFVGSEVFTVIFIILGHYIFTNLFIGVIIAVRKRREREGGESDREKRGLNFIILIINRTFI